MRTLIITIGSQASGKTTWIKNNNLQNYTISIDEIRKQFQTPSVDIYGNKQITTTDDKKVWEKGLKEITKENSNEGILF